MTQETALELLQNRLQALDQGALRRHLIKRQGQDLCSNDYLGFASDPDFQIMFLDALEKEKNLGAAGSRLLRGHLDLHQRVENELAQFCGAQGALMFASGYQANLALLQGLLGPKDLVFSDALNHASLIDGIRLSRARKVIFRHRDLDHLAEHLKDQAASRTPGQLWVIATESLFSMDGDLADLAGLQALAETYGALFVVDEAHSTGIFGAKGQGLIQKALKTRQENVISVHTGGKALGVAGAWIGASQTILDTLTNFSRPFIFSTGALPALAIGLEQACLFWQKEGAQRAVSVLNRSQSYQQTLGVMLTRDGLAKDTLEQARGPILPVIIGSNASALKAAAGFQEHGLDVRAVRPPTVPKGTARLRLTVCHRTPESAWEKLFTGFPAVLSPG